MSRDTILEETREGFDIRVKMVDDNAPDTSAIGEYTDKIEDGVIIRDGERPGEFYEDLTDDEREKIPCRGNKFRAFKPYAGGEKVGTDDYRMNGKQDYERMEGLNRGDWYFVGVVAKVFKKGIELGNASLWGIESDAGDYFNEVAKEVADEAMIEAKKNLAALCADAKAGVTL